MKKLVFIAIMATSMTAFVGCGSTNKATVQDTKVEEVVQEETKQEDEAQETTQEETKQEDTGENSNQPPITYDMLSVESELMEPDSIGNVYFKGKYTNNSDKILVGLQYEILLKDSNEKVYYDCYDTVLPGETSSNFSGFGPASGNKEDIEVLKESFVILNDDLSKTHVELDWKLNEYTWYDTNTSFGEIGLEGEAPISLDKFGLSVVLDEPDSLGNVYGNMTYTNTFDNPITTFQAEILLKDSNEKVYYDCYDTVLPGETSPTFSGSGPSTQNTDDMQILSISVILRNDDGTETCVKHDSKTRVYEWNVRNN